jgi:hypothetical protein
MSQKLNNEEEGRMTMQELVKKQEQLKVLKSQLIESEEALEWDMSPPNPPFVIKARIRKLESEIKDLQNIRKID